MDVISPFTLTVLAIATVLILIALVLLQRVYRIVPRTAKGQKKGLPWTS